MTALALVDPRPRVRALLGAHGRDTVSAQALEPGFRYFFDGDDAVVAYVEAGRAWVAAGGPVAPPARAAEVAARFAAAARAARRRACFFGVEAEGLAATGLPALAIGEQPVWDTAGWADLGRAHASLRYQLRRAAAKGVAVRPLDARALDGDARAGVEALLGRWRATRRMAPMGFLVQLAPLVEDPARRLLVAERGGAPVGLLSAVPVGARGRLFVEDLVRDPAAPNGTVELLVDHALRAARADGLAEATLGLAPLSGPLPGWLRAIRWASRGLYDFEGLRAFKARLRPHRWEPVYLCAAPGTTRVGAVRDSLRAFAGGSFVRFGWRTLARARR